MDDGGLQALGQTLRRRREALGLSRARLASRLGISATYVALIEDARQRPAGRGKPSRPGPDVLRRWAEALTLNDRSLFELAGYLGGDDADLPREAVGMASGPLTDPLSDVRDGGSLVSDGDEAELTALLRRVLALAHDAGGERDAVLFLRTALELLEFRLRTVLPG